MPDFLRVVTHRAIAREVPDARDVEDGRAIPGNTLVVGAGFSTGDDTVGQVVVAVTATAPYDFQNLGYAIVANAAADIGALVRFDIR